ncbi:ankyrin repeat domain-containing protein [Streptomyces sp. CAU 1734]|uniref:ankyrin repeat domain-containing protein n=1 Tax=Streptomyces sp. CAU 1734 TaxID=3140360 RepID=UPI003260D05F
MKQRMRKKLAGRLVEAATFGETSRIEELLSAGADPGYPDGQGTTPLYAASVHGAAPVVRLLLRAGADPDAESGVGLSEGTPLCAAAWWGHTEAVRALLEAGADPGRREDAGEGRSPREWATAGAHPEIAALLEGIVPLSAVPGRRA